jgi:hypothetical protein
MRCREVRESLEELREEQPSAIIQEHVARCPDCHAYAEDWRFLRSGFSALAKEPGPEASIGFVARMVRRLEEAAKTDASRDFLEQAGRRVAWATLLVALTVVLVLLLPSWSPLHGPTGTAELYPTPQIAAAETDPVFADDNASSLRLTPVNSSGEATKGVEQKQR